MIQECKYALDNITGVAGVGLKRYFPYPQSIADSYEMM